MSLKKKNRYYFMMIYIITALFVTYLNASARKDSVMHPLKELNTPIFWAEGHPGKLSRQNWEIEVTGLCKNPKTFNWEELISLPKTTVPARLTSVTQWSVFGHWGGIKLSDILNLVEADSAVKYVRFWSHRMIYDTSIPIEIAKNEKTLLAYDFNDVYLSEDYGGPVRVFCPYLWGYKSAKSVVKIELMNHYVPGFWETRGYTDSAEIEPTMIYDVNDNNKPKWNDGGNEVIFDGDGK